jgi:hypothetical protein
MDNVYDETATLRVQAQGLAKENGERPAQTG